MAQDAFRNMIIKRVIVHQVFRRDTDNKVRNPFFSSECVTLSDDFNTKMKERIIKLLGQESHSIRMEIEDDGEESTYSHVVKYWKCKSREENKFIDASKEITNNLVKIQDSRRYPDALLLCVEGTVRKDNRDFFCIIKAESQDGFLITQEAEKIGLDYIANLFMTKNEKFQKLGMFIKTVDSNDNIPKNVVETYLFDSNTDDSISKAKAKYFYHDFLGLNFRNDSKKQTSAFFHETKNFINSIKELNDVEKIELTTELLDYINDPDRMIINAGEFAKKYFSATVKGNYVRFLEEKQIDTNSIHKDVKMLGNALKYRKLCFGNFVKLQIPSDLFSEDVDIKRDAKSGETLITIKGMMLNER